MAKRNTGEIRVRLNKIEELFAEPESDPFDPDSRYRSGLDELLEQMHGLRSKEIRVVIELEPTTIEPGSQEKVEAAFRRYCQARIDELQRLLREHWRLTCRQLATAALVFLTLFASAVLVVTAESLPTYLQTLIMFCLGVFAYATLWAPADLLLYAWRPYQEDLRRHRRLLVADLEIRSRD